MQYTELWLYNVCMYVHTQGSCDVCSWRFKLDEEGERLSKVRGLLLLTNLLLEGVSSYYK